METHTAFENTYGQVQSGSEVNFDSSRYQRMLKELGNQIEALADQMKSSGFDSKGEELHLLGDQVEHFCDQLDMASPAEKSQSTVPLHQVCG
jgi:hypothetical protein